MEEGFYVTPKSASDVAVADSYAYMAAGSAGLILVSIADPTNPMAVTSYDTPGLALDIAISGGIAYVADSISGLRLISITGWVELGYYVLPYPGAADRVAVAGDYAFVVGQSGFRVVSVTDPASPVEVGLYPTHGWAQGVAISGSYAYVAYRYSLRVINISNPYNLYEVGSSMWMALETSFV